MKELIYSVENIFNSNNQEGCLPQYEAKHFHIPAYQRGYKWGSEITGAVTILLNDLWEAYQTSSQKEYYLQYITVKQIKIGGISALEVIDGQQRLTTLSLLLSVCSLQLSITNISSGKLDYAIRSNFFTEHIYRNEDLKDLLEKKWKELEAKESFNKQDVWYLFTASQKINSFLKNKGVNDVKEFYDYLLNNVKIIVNSVEPHVKSEDVFKNLNSNKVPLTEVELIKGLLITKVGRLQGNKNHFKELLEIRTNIGRNWDEITRWANKPEIKSFYFEDKEGMHELLTLVAKRIATNGLLLQKKKTDTDFPLFNFFHQSADKINIYETIKSTQKILEDWYQHDAIYNLIGFCRFVKDSVYNKPDFLLNCFSKTKSELKSHLIKTKEELLTVNPEKMFYRQDDNSIHAVLLALSVFPEGQQVRFNFHAFLDEQWSLEHIFPQSPEGKDQKLSKDHKDAIIEMLGDDVTEDIQIVLAKVERTEDEKKLYYEALQKSSELNSIGNMCLLAKGDNSSNGCMFFNEKKKNILKLIQNGSFVPKHTFDVFSKMIVGIEESDPAIWSKKDIEAHKQYIKSSI